MVKGWNDAEVDVHGLKLAHGVVADIKSQRADGRFPGKVDRCFAQQAAAQAATSVRAEGSDKLQQLTRKLEAAHAEIRRYQTRLFACERQMIALRRENADLEAACEQAREELQMAVARAEKAEQQAAQTPACPEVPVQAPTPEPPEEAVACCARPAAQPAAPPEPVWQPETELEKLSVELLRRFDEMMQE